MKRSKRGEKKPRRRRKGAEEQERKAKNDKGCSPVFSHQITQKTSLVFSFSSCTWDMVNW
jgi:hypothetical protein